jgi:hypothetical protein
MALSEREVDARILAFLAQGRVVRLDDASFLGWVTGVGESDARDSLQRLRAQGRLVVLDGVYRTADS